MRDEIFCQLCKQTNGCPLNNALIKGWKLMVICCAIFTPSQEFILYLSSYLFCHTKQMNEIGKYAIFALKSLDKTMEMGTRNIIPLELEIKKLELMQKIEIKIYLLDNTFKNIMISSQSTVKQIINILYKIFGLKYNNSFSLYEMEIIKPGWEKQVYMKRDCMNKQEKIDNLQYMPYNNELNMNERIMDIISLWKRSNKKKQRNLRLVFKCKLYSKYQEKLYNKMEWKLLFLSSVWNVINGMYRLNEKYKYDLAA
eukprot:99942_1